MAVAEPKSRTLNVRLTAVHVARLDALVRQLGLSRGGVIRELLSFGDPQAPATSPDVRVVQLRDMLERQQLTEAALARHERQLQSLMTARDSAEFRESQALANPSA